jgi:hypothetical protein
MLKITVYSICKAYTMIRELIIRIINHLSGEVHPDAEWF